MNKNLIGIDKLITESWSAVSKDWRPTLGWTLGLIILPVLVNFVFALPQIALPKLTENFVYQLVAFLGVWFTSIYFQLGLFKYFLNEKQSVSVAFKDVLSIAWIGTIATLILIPAFIFFILPGIWLTVAFSMGMACYLKENKTGWQALKSSYGLVKGHWWATFIRFLIPNLIYQIVIATVIGLIMSLIGGGTIMSRILLADDSFPTATGIILVFVAGLVFLGLLLISAVVYVIAQTSIWTNIYKSLSNTQTE